MSRKKLDVSNRKESYRDKKSVVDVAEFTLDQIKGHFDESVAAIKAQIKLSQELNDDGKNDISDNILRAQVVFLGSCLDFYIHEISKYAVIQIYDGEWAKTERYNSLMIPLGYLKNAIADVRYHNWLLNAVNAVFSKGVYLSYESMRDQLNLSGLPMQDVIAELFSTTKECSCFIDQFYGRRNRIAHQLDRGHNDAVQAEIDETYVNQCVATVQAIVSKIHEMAKKKDDEAYLSGNDV